ncbi:hypothetical protein BDI4_120019 [Burkholderia diffusa]|nr:hypothetical protein BDI4_120019 [Burkholderia diffusa]
MLREGWKEHGDSVVGRGRTMTHLPTSDQERRDASMVSPDRFGRMRHGRRPSVLTRSLSGDGKQATPQRRGPV